MYGIAGTIYRHLFDPVTACQAGYIVCASNIRALPCTCTYHSRALHPYPIVWRRFPAKAEGQLHTPSTRYLNKQIDGYFRILGQVDVWRKYLSPSHPISKAGIQHTIPKRRPPAGTAGGVVNGILFFHGAVPHLRTADIQLFQRSTVAHHLPACGNTCAVYHKGHFQRPHSGAGALCKLPLRAAKRPWK